MLAVFWHAGVQRCTPSTAFDSSWPQAFAVRCGIGRSSYTPVASPVPTAVMASSRCLRVLLSLPVLAAAETSFSSTPAQLEAKVTLQTNGSWHLGGFCFGQAGPEETKAAELAAHVEWQGTKELGETGPVMLVGFDAREHRWGAVKDSWGQLSCEEKLSAANMQRQLGKTHNLADFFFSIHVHQKSAMRDWHFALLTCGETEQAPLSVTLSATNGALSMFKANTHFDASSCPVAPLRHQGFEHRAA